MDIVDTYLAYVAISVGLTVWVGHALFRNGRVFLVDVFGGNGTLADAVNRLLVVGFYLLSFGYVALTLRLGEAATTVRASVETLSIKVGGVLLVLGLVHFANLLVLSRIRRRGQQRAQAGTAPSVTHTSPWTRG